MLYNGKNERAFSRDELLMYLKEFAKQYRKDNPKTPTIEIILVGGAAVILDYGFRDTTTDIDAMYMSSRSIKAAIKTVADKNNLPVDWLNDDFKRTDSYSNKIRQYSRIFVTYSKCVEIRTVLPEYLIAMKLVAGRDYKKDLSDIVGILKSCEESGEAIDFATIDRAIINLYGSWDKVKAETREIMNLALKSDNLNELYALIEETEQNNRLYKIERETVSLREEHGDIKTADSDELLKLL